MAVTRARSASQPGAGADSSTPNPGKPFGTRSPLYRCWPHRLSTSGGNDAGVLRKLGPQKQRRHRSQLFSSAGPPLLQRSLTAAITEYLDHTGTARRLPGWHDARELVAQILEVARADAQIEHFLDPGGFAGSRLGTLGRWTPHIWR